MDLKMIRSLRFSHVLILLLAMSAGLLVSARIKSHEDTSSSRGQQSGNERQTSGVDTELPDRLPILPLENTVYIQEGDRLTFIEGPELIQVYASLDHSPIEVHQDQGTFWLEIPAGATTPAQLLIDQIFKDSSTARLPITIFPPDDGSLHAIEPGVSTGVVVSLIQLDFTDFTVIPPNESAGRGPSSLVCSADGTTLILDGVGSRVASLDPDGAVRTARVLPSQWFTTLVTNPSKSLVVALDLFNLQAIDVNSGRQFTLPAILGRLPARVEYTLNDEGLMSVRSPVDNHLYAVLQLGDGGANVSPLSEGVDGPRWWSTTDAFRFQESDVERPLDVHIPGGNWQTLGQIETADGRVILLGTTGPDGSQPALLVIDRGVITMYLIDVELESWNLALEFVPALAACNGNVRIVGASESHLLVIEVAL